MYNIHVSFIEHEDSQTESIPSGYVTESPSTTAVGKILNQGDL